MGLGKSNSGAQSCKTFLEGNLDFPEIQNLLKVCSMPSPAQKCKIMLKFNQKYTQKLSIV